MTDELKLLDYSLAGRLMEMEAEIFEEAGMKILSLGWLPTDCAIVYEQGGHGSRSIHIKGQPVFRTRISFAYRKDEVNEMVAGDAKMEQRLDEALEILSSDGAAEGRLYADVNGEWLVDPATLVRSE
jgi:hypothetical protein